MRGSKWDLLHTDLDAGMRALEVRDERLNDLALAPECPEPEGDRRGAGLATPTAASGGSQEDDGGRRCPPSPSSPHGRQRFGGRAGVGADDGVWAGVAPGDAAGDAVPCGAGAAAGGGVEDGG